MVAELTRPVMAGVQTAPMRPRHLGQVLAIERSVYPKPWSRSVFLSELAQGDFRRYVVALGQATGWWRHRPVVGYAGLMLAVDEAHITTVAVHPAHHRRKIASRLLCALLREARALGAASATLEVRVANRGAQRLYGGFGFAPVGTRPGYYAETGEDALIMWAYQLQSQEFADRLAGQESRLKAPGGSSGAPDLEVPWVKGRVGLGEGST
ncbi:MAG: ribosomal protein S18-alanine N-acetyltransferase [Egibacteraceae bacterium]